ncbi:MAG: outer membrane beta-barrel protein [Bacteroidia bacterium]|nr:outer membrane beta-barrel protein [Bacteroidia bacterium]
MKKILTLFLLVALATPLLAQEGLHIGIGFSPQNTWILNSTDFNNSTDNFDPKFTWGWAGQFKLGYNFGPPFGIHLNAIYSKQGQENTRLDTVGRQILVDRTLTYVKVPLYFHFSSNPAPVMFTFGFGPYMTFLQDASIKEDGIDIYNFDPTELYKPQNFGIAGYMGADFQLVEDIMYFNARATVDYNFGDIEDKSAQVNGQPFFSSSRLRSNNLVIGLNFGVTWCILPQGGGRNAGKFWIR